MDSLLGARRALRAGDSVPVSGQGSTSSMNKSDFSSASESRLYLATKIQTKQLPDHELSTNIGPTCSSAAACSALNSEGGPGFDVYATPLPYPASYFQHLGTSAALLLSKSLVSWNRPEYFDAEVVVSAALSSKHLDTGSCIWSR